MCWIEPNAVSFALDWVSGLEPRLGAGLGAGLERRRLDLQRAWLRRQQLRTQGYRLQRPQHAVHAVHKLGQYSCSRCGRAYKFLPSLRNHQKLECGMEPQFACPHCIYRAKRKHHLDSHLRTQHPYHAGGLGGTLGGPAAGGTTN